MAQENLDPLDVLAAHIIALHPEPASPIEICTEALNKRENLIEACLARPVRTLHDLELLLQILEDELEHEGVERPAAARSLLDLALGFARDGRSA